MTSHDIRVVGLETSSPRLSLALGDGTRVLRFWSGTEHWRHAESLLAGLDTLLKKQRWSFKDLTGVAVSIGPGSFTGMRIGLAAARALGQFLAIPVVGVSALEILAYSRQEKVMVPVIDALRGAVFSGVYTRTGPQAWKRLHADTRWLRADWEKACQAWRKKYGTLTVVEAGQTSNRYPRADHLLQLAVPRIIRANAMRINAYFLYTYAMHRRLNV